MTIRFAFDLGSASIGAAVIHIPCAKTAAPAILWTGIRKFDDPVRRATSDRLAERQRQNRYIKRRRARLKAFAALLRKAALLPADPAERTAFDALDPYELRACGLDRPLTRHEFGRALWHLHKHRFRRQGVPPDAICQQSREPDAWRTYGEYLWNRHRGSPRTRKTVRQRRHLLACGQAARAATRDAIVHEFDALVAAQDRFCPGILPDALRLEIRSALTSDAPVGGPAKGRKGARDAAVAAFLRELRPFANAMAARFGAPDCIAVEDAIGCCGRDRGASAAARRETARLKAELAGLGMTPSRDHVLRLRLYHRQAAAAAGEPVCPYSGEQITLAGLFAADIEIDHVVPSAWGGGNGDDNLVLCTAASNRAKGAQTPFAAFGHTSAWSRIEERASLLPPDLKASVLLRDTNRFPTTGTGARSVNDMGRISKAAWSFFSARWPGARQIAVSPLVVAAARERLRIESGACLSVKNRHDHRHHALDAMLAGLAGAVRLPAFPAIIDATARANVTTRPLRQKKDRLVAETIYGRARDGDAARGNCVYRKPLEMLTKSELRAIRDKRLRQDLTAFTDGKDAKGLSAHLHAFSTSRAIHRVRLVRRMSGAVGALGDPSRMLVPAGNHHIDIVALRDGRWVAFGATRLEVNQPGFRPRWERERVGGKLVMRLHHGDALEIDDEHGARTIRIVHRLCASNGYIYLAAPHEGGPLATRHAKPDDPFRWDMVNAEGLRRRGARAVEMRLTGECVPRRSNVLT